jgi:hypothetical protein
MKVVVKECCGLCARTFDGGDKLAICDLCSEPVCAECGGTRYGPVGSTRKCARCLQSSLHYLERQSLQLKGAFLAMYEIED